MSISSSIFKAYDIRGIVDDTLTEDAAYCCLLYTSDAADE